METTMKRREELKKGFNTYYMHCIIGMLIMFIFWVIEPIGPVTPVGMRVLGVFLGIIYLWSFVDTLWTSLIGIFMLGLTGVNSMDGVISSAFGSPMVIMIMYVIVLTGAITEVGICDYIARWFITRKIINGKPWMFSAMLLLGVYMLSTMTIPTATIFIFWPILYSVFKILGIKQGDKYGTLMLIAVVVTSNFGFATTPFKGILPGLISNLEGMTGARIEYLPYMIAAIILSLVGIAAIVLLMKYVFRPDITCLKEVHTDMFNKQPLPKMNLRQKILVAMLGIFVFWVLAPSILPESLFKTFLSNSQNAIAMLLVAIGCFIKIEDKPVINYHQIFAKHMAWPVVLIVGAAVTIGNALTSESTGIVALMKELVTPLFAGKSVMMFIVIMLVLSCILTNLCNNMVVGMLLMPIIHIFTSEIGMNPLPVAMLILFVVCLAVVTPAGSPTAAILHGNREWLETKDIYKYSIIMSAVILVITLIVGLPLANILF